MTIRTITKKNAKKGKDRSELPCCDGGYKQFARKCKEEPRSELPWRTLPSLLEKTSDSIFSDRSQLAPDFEMFDEIPDF